MRLSSTRALDDVGRSANFKISVGESAVLNMGTLRDSAGFIDNLEVTVSKVEGATLQLELIDKNGSLEKRCLNLLPDSNDEDPSQAHSSDLSRYRPDDCLQVLQQQSVSGLEELLKDYLIDLCNHLLDLSAKSKQVTSGENVHYEAMNAVKKHGIKIIGSVSQRVNEHYKNLTPNKETRNDSAAADEESANLNLVDIKEFEGDLAVARMVKLGEELYGTALECLIIRLADIIERDPHTVRLPMHVAQLCDAFQHAIEGRGIPERAMPDLLDFFGQQFIRRLESYYGPLNEFLIEQGICPELEEEIAAKGSLLNRPGPLKKSRESKHTDNLKSEVRAIEPQATQPVPKLDPDAKQKQFVEEQASAIAGGVIEKLNDRFSPDSLYQSVIDALNFKREAVAGAVGGSGSGAGSGTSATGAQQQQAGPGAAQPPVPAGNPADASSIAKVLGQMQQDANLRNAVQESPSLREYLANNQADIRGLEDTQGLSSDSLNQLDLVDTMFGSIKSQMDVTAELKPVLGNLQIPLAKLALLEPQFFVDRDHSARGVMDKLVAKQEQAMTRNVDRVVRTQEGNEKLRQAQQAVQEILGARIAPPAAPEVLANLVDSGWRDLHWSTKSTTESMATRC